MFLVILHYKKELCRIQSGIGIPSGPDALLFFIDEIVFFLISSIVIGPLIFQVEDLRLIFLKA